MIRKIIHIDEEKCNGCGACAAACHEGAIDMVDGKAKLMREDYCDGLGDCLPGCPTGAITFEEREAPEYNEEAVRESKLKKLFGNNQNEMNSANGNAAHGALHFGGGCPGSRMQMFNREQDRAENAVSEAPMYTPASAPVSQLAQWPCQIKLVPVNAPYFSGAKLLIAADCTAYAYANIHQEFMRGKITIIGCPKLDDIDYSEKLTQIIKNNDIKSVTILRMEVPCCGGLENAAKKAIMQSGKFLPWQVVTFSVDGKILD